MRLTNTDRDAFIKAVLDDVPFVDYQELARVAVQKKAIELLPAKLRALHKELGHWLKTDRLWGLPGGIKTVVIVSFDEEKTCEAVKADTAFWATIEKMALDMAAQTEQRDALRSKLRSCIYACTTVKQARERLPEFGKYLPSGDDSPVRTLPAVANVVADLVAAGWPKGKKPATRKGPVSK